MGKNKIFNYSYQVKSSNRHIDENGFLMVKNCLLLHDGVMEYKGYELGKYVDGVKIEPDKTYKVNISYDELLKAKDTFSMKPVTYGHVFLGKDGENPLHYQEGSVGENIEVINEVDEDGIKKNFLVATIAFNNLQTIEAIEKGRKQELSTSYSNILKVAKPNSGYDFEAIDIVANHVALVRKGRAGSKVKVANESLENIKEVKEIMENEENISIKSEQECSPEEITNSTVVEDDSTKVVEEKVVSENENINDYLNIKTTVEFDKQGNKVIKITQPNGNDTSVSDFTNSDAMNFTSKTEKVETNVLPQISQPSIEQINISSPQQVKSEIKSEMNDLRNQIYSTLDILKNLLDKINFAEKTMTTNNTINNEDETYERIKNELKEENRNIINAFNEVKPRVGDFDFTDMSAADIYKRGLKSCKKIILNGDESLDTLRSMYRTMNAVSSTKVVNNLDLTHVSEFKLPDYIKS